GMAQIGLVAARNDHGGAIARTDIIERNQYVNLAAVEFSGMEAVLGTDGADMAAGVETQRLAGAAHRGETFVDEGRAVVAVEIFGVVRADEVDCLAEPGRVVDEALPGRPAFIDLLEDEALLPAGVIVELDLAMPAVADEAVDLVEQ